ncbi:MAG: mechanosensitive ion channel domain-containing protein [Bacteroidota bacterium]
MLTTSNLRSIIVLYCLLLLSTSSIAQSKHKQNSNNSPIPKTAKADTTAFDKSQPDNLLMLADTLTSSDYMLSIQRVNDKVNEIKDSVKLDFDISDMELKIDNIAKYIVIIRQNTRNKNAVVRIKALYLYQNLATNLDNEVKGYQAHVNKMFNTVYNCKQRLKMVLSDPVFHKLYTDSSLRKTYEKKLSRLEKKWAKTDSTTKANIDSLNMLKLKIADNAISLTNILKILETKIDKAGTQLFAQEVNNLWQKPMQGSLATDTANTLLTNLRNEGKIIGYYYDQTKQQKWALLILASILFSWLFLRRKLFKRMRTHSNTFEFLHLQYLNHNPVLPLLILLFCLMPLFDAYAPTAYLALEYFVALVISFFIFFKNKEHFRFHWLLLIVLFLATVLTFILITPNPMARIGLIALHAAIIVVSIRFAKRLNNQMPFFKLMQAASVVTVLLAALAIICNIFGRFSLSNILGIASIFAITQAVMLPIFIQTIIEIVLLQLQSSRLKKGVDKPFNGTIVIKKIKTPLLILGIVLWCIMLASNLNIYHNLSNTLVNALTVTRSLGSITYKLGNVLFFFAIIWLAHILQQLISFLFGETGSENEDTTPGSKAQHSRLLIMRLLILIGGYLLAIAASGLPLDKLTFLLGALGIGIGMGLQNMVNNFVSGIILIFDGSLKIGDEIEIGGQSGKVKEIGLRASTLNTSDGAEVIIPNGTILSQNITNWTLSNDEKRVMLQFSLSGKDLDANMVNEVINTTIKQLPNVISKRNPVILYTKVKQETYSLTLQFWCVISKSDIVKSDAILHLNKAFTTKNIGFVFNSFTTGELFVNVTES